MGKIPVRRLVWCVLPYICYLTQFNYFFKVTFDSSSDNLTTFDKLIPLRVSSFLWKHDSLLQLNLWSCCFCCWKPKKLEILWRKKIMWLFSLQNWEDRKRIKTNMHDWEKVDKKIGCIQSSLRYYKKITTVTVIRRKKRLEKSLENDSKFLLKSLKVLSNIVN